MPTYKVFIQEDWPNKGNYIQLGDIFTNKDDAWELLKITVEEKYYWVSLDYNEGYSIQSWENEGPFCYMNIGHIQTIYTPYEVMYNTYMDNLSTIKTLEEENKNLAFKMAAILKEGINGK